MKYNIKARDTYNLVFDRVQKANSLKHLQEEQHHITDISNDDTPAGDNNNLALVPANINSGLVNSNINSNSASGSSTGQQLIPKKAPTIPKPKWHAPWKLYRVISGHLGWVNIFKKISQNQKNLFITIFRFVVLQLNREMSGLRQVQQIE